MRQFSVFDVHLLNAADPFEEAVGPIGNHLIAKLTSKVFHLLPYKVASFQDNYTLVEGDISHS